MGFTNETYQEKTLGNGFRSPDNLAKKTFSILEEKNMIILLLLLLIFLLVMGLKFLVFGPLMIIGIIVFVLGLFLFLI